MNIYEGEVFCIDKPYRMTSFAAVARVRGCLSRALNVKRVKIGHAGTLDPLATGVLLLATGKATKSIAALQATEKEYVATLQFGATTASYDLEQPLDATFPTDGVTRATLLSAIQNFIGDIAQVPPQYSAVKTQGKRAYEYARHDEQAPLRAKSVHIAQIDLLAYDDEGKTAQLRVVCGKGTYIRSLARDLGAALHSGAHLTALCRTRVGRYTLADAIALDAFPSWLHQQTLAPYAPATPLP